MKSKPLIWVKVSIVISLLMVIGTLGCTDDEVDNRVKIIIEYEGAWSGTIEVGKSTDTSSDDIEGTGPAEYEARGSIITVVVKKEDNSTSKLKVELLVNDKTVATDSTTKVGGIVTVSYYTGCC